MDMKSPVVLLSDFEVSQLISDLKTVPENTTKPELCNLSTIIYETSQYFQSSPCHKQTEKCVENLLIALDKFPVSLTKLEKFMLINNPPETVLQLSLTVKDCEDRMTDEQILEMLTIIETCSKDST